MVFRTAVVALTVVAILGFVVSVSTVTADKRTDVEKVTVASVIMHDFGVTLFPTYMDDARPTCALQSPSWIFRGKEIEEEEFTGLWPSLPTELGTTTNTTTTTISDPFIAFYPANPDNWPKDGVNLDVSISFDGGYPFYYYPRAAEVDKSIDWNNLKLTTSLPYPVNLKKVNKIALKEKKVDHWYSEARKGDSLYAVSGNTGDKFLFYGGYMQMKPALSLKVEDGRFYITSLLGTTLKDVAFINKRGKDIFYARIDSLAPGVKDIPIKAQKLDISIEKFADEEGSRWGLTLRKAGLAKHEADCVVKMMRKDLLEADGIRAIYLATGKVMDDMALIKISPRPIKTVRTSICAVILEK